MSVATGTARRIGDQPVAYAWLLITAEIICSGSDAAGERAAAIYSLVGSAKLTELDPHAYLLQACCHRTYRRSSSQSYR